jgi:hypothetical protein
MDDHMKKAAALANELQKLLAGMPHPWNKQFHVYLQPLQSLMMKLQDIS